MIKSAPRTASEAVSALKKLSTEVPVAAVVLGSGVSVLDKLVDAAVLPYQDLFGMAPGVVGHSGTLTVGRVEEDGPLVAVLRGRFHLYEGYDWSTVTLATRAIVEWGVPNLLLTNAAGGLNLDYSVGDLMVLTGYRDHLNPELKATGLLPAIAKPATDCRNKLSEKLVSVGETLDITLPQAEVRPLQQGVYAGLLGPTYETMAEIDMLRKLKADAVGMSTVPEMLCCDGTNTTAAAVSVITNVWRPEEAMGGHEEVLEASKNASKRLDKLFKAVLAELG
ncbi:MAG: purine-nucleoside phosphorylase [Candidatus Obscuribacterales bacterium]|jgi:purine-nucleoside phosphorylase